MATEKGLVVRSYAGVSPTVLVRTGRSGACESCSSRDSCGAGNKKIEIELPNLVGACVGDVVLLNMAAFPLLKTTFLVYIFPILSMVFGVCLGHVVAIFSTANMKSNLPSVCAVLFLVLSFGVIRFVGNRLSTRPEYKPEILRIVSQLTCSDSIH